MCEFHCLHPQPFTPFPPAGRWTPSTHHLRWEQYNNLVSNFLNISQLPLQTVVSTLWICAKNSPAAFSSAFPNHSQSKQTFSWVIDFCKKEFLFIKNGEWLECTIYSSQLFSESHKYDLWQHRNAFTSVYFHLWSGFLLAQSSQGPALLGRKQLSASFLASPSP